MLSYSDRNYSKDPNIYEGMSVDEKLDFNRLYNPNLGLSKIVTIEKTRAIFYYLGGLMIFCSLFVEVFYVIKKGPLYMK